MKNKILFAFASLFLVGCAQNNGLDIVKNAIDLTPSNEISKIQQGIVNLRNGFVFEGTLTRTRTFYKNSSFLENAVLESYFLNQAKLELVNN